MTALVDSQIFYLPRPGRLTAYVNSRFRSLDIDNATVQEILSHYQLTTVAPSRNLPNTRRNRNLIVKTETGKKILKLYRNDWQQSTITFEHSILNELNRRDSPAPRPRRTQNGDTFINYGGQHYAVFEFIQGKTFTSSYLLRSHRLHLMSLAGRALASLHRKLRGFQPLSYHHLGFADLAGERHRDQAWHSKKVAELMVASRHIKEPEDKELATQLVRQSDSVLQAIDQLESALNEEALIRLVIHGDYGLHNLLFRGLRAIPVDFESARLEWRLSDLVSCLSKLRFADGNHDFESMKSFLQGYEQEFPIADDEWQCLPRVWQFYRLMGAVQYWKSYFDTGGPVRKLYSALDAIHQANWAKDNPDKILAIRPGSTALPHG